MTATKTFTETMEERGWERVSLWEVARRTGLRNGPNKWRWAEEQERGRTLLFLENREGERWQFRAHRGCWIKRVQ